MAYNCGWPCQSQIVTPDEASITSCHQLVSLDSANLHVFLGELHGVRSPVHTFTPLLGAQLDLNPNVETVLDIDPHFEHGVLLDLGDVEVAGVPIAVGELACQSAGPSTLTRISTQEIRRNFSGEFEA